MYNLKQWLRSARVLPVLFLAGISLVAGATPAPGAEASGVEGSAPTSADLKVSSLIGECVKAPGPTLSVLVGVENTSDVATSHPVVMVVSARVYWTVGPKKHPRETASKMMEVGTGTLEEGFLGEKTFSFDVSVPETTTVVQLSARVETVAGLSETDTDNNHRQVQFTCTFE